MPLAEGARGSRPLAKVGFAKEFGGFTLCQRSKGIQASGQRGYAKEFGGSVPWPRWVWRPSARGGLGLT